MARVKETLTLKQLDETLKLLRLSPEAREIARLRLVVGRTYPSIAETIGVSKQYANEITKKVYNRYLTSVAKQPPGWIKPDFYAPPELVEELRKKTEKALKSFYAQK